MGGPFPPGSVGALPGPGWEAEAARELQEELRTRRHAEVWLWWVSFSKVGGVGEARVLVWP